MRSINWFRAAFLAILIALLGIPPSVFTARAQDQKGPITPGTQQPIPPKPPTGQQGTQQSQQIPPPQASISSESNLVNVDTVVTDQDGNIITGLQKQNFRILADGQTQQIANFAPSDAPITIVILMEFSNKSYGFWNGAFGYKAEYWAYDFLNHLTNKDWVAFKTYDLKTTLRVDFTHDRNEVAQAIEQLAYPDFSEANLFDAVYETVDQLRDVKGKKSILILATGFDTFSKHHLDQIYDRLKETDVTIFCIGMAEEMDLYSPGGAGVGYLQAKNQLTQFADMTGGYAWFPRFGGEMPDIFNSVTALLRNQYTLGFAPAATPDGKYHKIKVEVLDNSGNPLEVANRKGKKKKVIVYARQGYVATLPAAAAGN